MPVERLFAAVRPVTARATPYRTLFKARLPARFPFFERVLETLLKGFARTLPLVDMTRGGLHEAEITGERVAN